MMARKDEELDERENGAGREDEREILPILHYIYEPTRKQLMGLTNIPISQVNNLVWMVVFDVETEQFCEYLDYKEKLREYEKNGEGELPKMPPQLSLSEIWGDTYSWLRRSIEGLGLMQAAQLANKQMETQELGKETPDMLDMR